MQCNCLDGNKDHEPRLLLHISALGLVHIYLDLTKAQLSKYLFHNIGSWVLSSLKVMKFFDTARHVDMYHHNIMCFHNFTNMNIYS